MYFILKYTNVNFHCDSWYCKHYSGNPGLIGMDKYAARFRTLNEATSMANTLQKKGLSTKLEFVR